MARKPTGKPPGRPKFEWSDSEYREFEILCSFQCTQAEICSFFRIDHETLNRLLQNKYSEKYSKIYDRFASVGLISLRRRIFKEALDHRGDLRAAIWLSKQHLGMSDKVTQDSKLTVDGTVTYTTEWGSIPDKAPKKGE